MAIQFVVQGISAALLSIKRNPRCFFSFPSQRVLMGDVLGFKFEVLFHQLFPNPLFLRVFFRGWLFEYAVFFVTSTYHIDLIRTVV